MATSAAARNAAARQGASPGRRTRQAPAERPSFGVLDRRHTVERARRRQARVLVAVSAGVVALALVLAAAGHALLASEQVSADTLNSKVAAAVAAQQNAQLERANLESPTRILSIAEQGLKMVTPPSVTYLVPVNPGPSVAEAHGAPAPGSGTHSQHQSSAASTHRSR